MITSILDRSFLCTAVSLAVLTASSCSTAPRSPEARADIIKDADRALSRARSSDQTVDSVLDDAYGIAVFPKVGKGAAGVGGAYGKGVLYEQGTVVGYCDLTQASVGLQLGGQTYTEILCFEDEKSLERFKDEDFTLSAQATAVALESGTGANAAYRDGVCVFTMDEAGLMFETAVGGQKFNYKDLAKAHEDDVDDLRASARN
jgi:lipid-binding SYLF domain-containing protein